MPRNEERSIFLDASLLKLERALISRAEALEEEAKVHPAAGPSMIFVAKEFRSLAEELRH